MKQRIVITSVSSSSSGRSFCVINSKVAIGRTKKGPFVEINGKRINGLSCGEVIYDGWLEPFDVMEKKLKAMDILLKHIHLDEGMIRVDGWTDKSIDPKEEVYLYTKDDDEKRELATLHELIKELKGES